MRRLSVIEIWGVATRLTKRLNALGIHSILDLSWADPAMIRDRFSVVKMAHANPTRATAGTSRPCCLIALP